MKRVRTIRTRRNEAGIALLISIFVLLLISVVAIALIVSSGTETSLAGNYRSSTGVYYAALAGVEEARGRLSLQDPNSLRNNSTWQSIDPQGGTFPIGTAFYILNPGPGDPTGATLVTSTYPDQEYASEFSSSPTVQTVNSVWTSTPLSGNLSFPVPLYKWVRINAVSEKSMNLDVDADGRADSTTPLYFNNGTRAFSNNSADGPQVFELTALAVQPNPSGQAQSSQKLLQYLVTPGPLPMPSFLIGAPLAALTLSGSTSNSPTFHAPASNSVYAVKGNDSLQGCSGAAGGSVAAVGLFGDYSGGSYASDITSLVNGIPTSASTPAPTTNPQQNYTGNTPPHSLPDVEYLSAYPASQQTPAQVDAIAQNIIQNADAVFVPAGSASTQTAFLTSLGMTATHRMTVIANGNLDISNWNNDGFGLLLVTGTFTYDPDTNWNGLILVIGQGIVNNTQDGQYKQINGAMFVAKTRDGSGNLLTGGIGGASVSFLNGMQGTGVRYSSCWVQKAQPLGIYKVLSFHEIASQ